MVRIGTAVIELVWSQLTLPDDTAARARELEASILRRRAANCFKRQTAQQQGSRAAAPLRMNNNEALGERGGPGGHPSPRTARWPGGRACKLKTEHRTRSKLQPEWREHHQELPSDPSAPSAGKYVLLVGLGAPSAPVLIYHGYLST